MNENALESEFFNEESSTSSQGHVNIVIVLIICFIRITMFEVYVLYHLTKEIALLLYLLIVS